MKNYCNKLTISKIAKRIKVFNNNLKRAKKDLQDTKNRDSLKNKYCLDHNITLIRIINISDIEETLNKFFNL